MEQTLTSLFTTKKRGGASSALALGVVRDHRTSGKPQTSRSQALCKAFCRSFLRGIWKSLFYFLTRAPWNSWKSFIQCFTIYKGLSLMLSLLITTTALWSRLKRYYSVFYNEKIGKSETAVLPKVTHSWVAVLGFSQHILPSPPWFLY